jgi:hypothetical protein
MKNQFFDVSIQNKLVTKVYNKNDKTTIKYLIVSLFELLFFFNIKYRTLLIDENYFFEFLTLFLPRNVFSALRLSVNTFLQTQQFIF